MPNVNFNEWIRENPTLFNFSDGPTEEWKTLICTYSFCGIVQNKEYAVDFHTGDLYFPRTPNGMAFISTALLLGRPVKVFLKTVYHIFLPISIPYEIYLTVQKERDQRERDPEAPQANLLKKCSVSVIHSLADIIRTPLYGTALMIIHIASLILFVGNPEGMHRLRLITGKLELELERGRKERCLIPCYQPIDNLMIINRRHIPQFNIDYEEARNEFEVGLINLTARLRLEPRSSLLDKLHVIAL